MDAEILEARIRAILIQDLELDVAELERDSGLITTDLIDSMSLVRLATYLERTLGITIPNKDINVDHFDSIAKIVSYVRSKLGD